MCKTWGVAKYVKDTVGGDSKVCGASLAQQKGNLALTKLKLDDGDPLLRTAGFARRGGVRTAASGGGGAGTCGSGANTAMLTYVKVKTTKHAS